MATSSLVAQIYVVFMLCNYLYAITFGYWYHWRVNISEILQKQKCRKVRHWIDSYVFRKIPTQQ